MFHQIFTRGLTESFPKIGKNQAVLSIGGKESGPQRPAVTGFKNASFALNLLLITELFPIQYDFLN